MSKIPLKRPDKRSVRLGTSYLAIIMVLCIGFSLVFYQISTKGLNLSFQTNSGPLQSQGADNNGLALQANSGVGSVSLSGDASENISGLNEQLQQRVQALREALQRRLILFNAGALIVGTGISYFLARRTLAPIEAAIDLQARFSSDASHELRTPLTALRARSEVALHDPHLTLAEAKRVIKDDVEQTHKLEQLAEGLLRLSRQDNPWKKQSVSLQEIANDAMNTVIPQAKSQHIIIEEHVPHVQVYADRQGLAQAVVILLENAIKYSPEGSTVYLGGSVDGKIAQLSVRDEGSGIHDKDLPHIFERFYRADVSRSKQGHGLGLSIAQKIITQQDGTITVRTAMGTGSVFTLTIPLVRL